MNKFQKAISAVSMTAAETAVTINWRLDTCFRAAATAWKSLTEIFEHNAITSSRHYALHTGKYTCENCPGCLFPIPAARVLGSFAAAE